MTHSGNRPPRVWVCAAAAALSFTCSFAALAANVPTLATYPLFLAPAVTPNVLVLFDNSGSMDATMAGKVVSGADPDTRSNIARDVLRSIIDNNRTVFNWGLGTFELSGAPALYNTQAYFLGSATTMVYTNNCSVAAGSALDATGYSPDGPQVLVSPPSATVPVYKDNCIQNPDVNALGIPRNGERYLTFERSGDDADINDVFYQSSTLPYAFGIGVVGAPTPNYYNIYSRRTATTTWTNGDFAAADCVPGYCPVGFTPTDAGFLPVAADLPRMLFIKRGWGYGNGITGRGRMVERVLSSSTATPADAAAELAHYNNLMAALAPETNQATMKSRTARSPRRWPACCRPPASIFRATSPVTCAAPSPTAARRTTSFWRPMATRRASSTARSTTRRIGSTSGTAMANGSMARRRRTCSRRSACSTPRGCRRPACAPPS